MEGRGAGEGRKGVQDIAWDMYSHRIHSQSGSTAFSEGIVFSFDPKPPFVSLGRPSIAKGTAFSRFFLYVAVQLAHPLPGQTYLGLGLKVRAGQISMMQCCRQYNLGPKYLLLPLLACGYSPTDLDAVIFVGCSSYHHICSHVAVDTPQQQ